MPRSGHELKRLQAGVDLPTARLESTHKWFYDLGEGVYVEDPHSLGNIITKVVITVEVATGEETYTDTDAYGYLATAQGQRDKRSKLTRVWVDPAFYEPFLNDVELLETPS